MEKWSEKEINEAIKLLKHKFSYKEIGLELNRTYGSVRLKLQKLGYKSSDENKEVRNCLSCNKEYETTILDERKFCNNSCSATYNNRLRGIENKTHDKKCIVCDNSIKQQHTFCSNSCFIKNKQADIFNKIENGDVSLYEKQYKKYLISIHGNQCMECGWDKINKTTGKVPIQLEHIDGDSDNNKLDNLKLLCPNCHSLTPTYGALNKGNGRDSKRKIKRREMRNKNEGDA